MKQESGFTVIELMVVLGIATILTGIAVLNLKKFDQASNNAANQIASLIKGARAYGITSTTTVEIKPVSSSAIQTSTGSTCGTTVRTIIPELSLSLPNGASLSNSTWSICYTSRGLSRDSIDIIVSDGSQSRTIQVVLGGGIRVI